LVTVLVLRDLGGHILLTLEKRRDIALQVNDSRADCFGGPRADQAAAERPGKDSSSKQYDVANFHENLLSCVCFSDKVRGQGRAHVLAIAERPASLDRAALTHFNGRARASKRLLGSRGSEGSIEQLRGCLGLVGLDEVADAVSLPALLVAFSAEGPLLAEARGGHAVGGDAEGDEVVLDGSGAAVA